MSELDRILKLAGFDETQGQVDEAYLKASDYKCKDCGDTMHEPTTDCPHDCDDETGDWWRDKDGNGVPDMAEATEERSMKEDDMEEAVGPSAEPFYEMQDMYAGGECPSKPHETIIDELVRFLSGDQLEDFVETFRRHHMDMGDEMFKDDVDLEEDDIDENAFNQAAAAAARAGKDTFEFGGKTHKTTMKKDTAHKLDDDVQMDEKMRDSQEYVKKLISQYDKNDPLEAETIEMIKKAYAQSNANPEKAASLLYDITSDNPTGDGTQYGDTDLSDALKNAMTMDQLLLMNPEAVRYIKKEYERAGGDFSKMDLKKSYPDKDLDYVTKQLSKESEESEEEVVSEAPTIDTTQLITLLKNAGLSEEAIQTKLNEWANTPDNIGEVEPTEHGDAYDFAQSVNLSLKKYLDAEDMKVNVKEHKVEDMKALYEAKKNS